MWEPVSLRHAFSSSPLSLQLIGTERRAAPSWGGQPICCVSVSIWDRYPTLALLGTRWGHEESRHPDGQTCNRIDFLSVISDYQLRLSFNESFLEWLIKPPWKCKLFKDLQVPSENLWSRETCIWTQARTGTNSLWLGWSSLHLPALSLYFYSHWRFLLHGSSRREENQEVLDGFLCRERGRFPSSFWFQFCMEGTFINRDGPSSSLFTPTLFIVVVKWSSLILIDDSPWFPVSHKVLFAVVLSFTSLPSGNQWTKMVCQADALAEMTPAACHSVVRIRRREKRLATEGLVSSCTQQNL